MREVTEPTTDEHGSEEHPSWVVVGAYRGSVSPPGMALFDSDIKHQHVVTVRVSRAYRKRDLHRDWIGGGTQLMEFTFSEAQWASFVSSMNSGSGVPATLGFHGGEDIPRAPYDPRLAHSIDEVQEAATRAQADVLQAFTRYTEHKTAGNLRSLQAAINNLPANLRFAADSLTEHAENVVSRAKADIEAYVINKAEQLGIDPADIGTPQLTEGSGTHGDS
jgi:hypothetical protein